MRQPEKNRLERIKIWRQLMNLDRPITHLYQCLSCKRMLPKSLMKYRYLSPEVKLLVYAKGCRTVIPSLCYTCMQTSNYHKPWVRQWWDIHPRPKLKRLKKEKFDPLYPSKKPWENGYGLKERLHFRLDKYKK